MNTGTPRRMGEKQHTPDLSGYIPGCCSISSRCGLGPTFVCSSRRVRVTAAKTAATMHHRPASVTLQTAVHLASTPQKLASWNLLFFPARRASPNTPPFLTARVPKHVLLACLLLVLGRRRASSRLADGGPPLEVAGVLAEAGGLAVREERRGDGGRREVI